MTTDSRPTKIFILLKSNYGQVLNYPICETAKRFAALVNRKTLTDQDLAHITALGYEVSRI